ncbi:MAG: PIG-L family deacetylase [Chloroflexi bacterium]|nr:PIG-L family deacetylase [Chloroflexota bacterium]
MTVSKKVLLAVLAHPDDETFGIGGTLALYSSMGVEVHLVCATRGEVGDVDPELMKGYASVAELRENELRCAAGTLGITGVHYLNYRDSGMEGTPDNKHPQALAAADINVVAREVTHYIRLLKPQVVITFDPIGGYRHPDHIAIHKAAVKAFDEASKETLYPDGLEPYTPQKLYFQTFPRGFLRFSVLLMRITGKDPRKFGRNGDIDLVPIAEARFPVNATVNYRRVVEKRDQASACHASQGGARITTGILAVFRKVFGVNDQFMRAFPPPGKSREKDLFANVE